MKNFVTLARELENFSLMKDVGMVPYYVAQVFGYNSTIISQDKGAKYPDLNYLNTRNIKGGGKKLTIKTLKGKRFTHLFIHFGIIKYLIKEGKNITVLNQYHFTIPTLLYGIIYKITNRKGIFYLKLDFDLQTFKDNGNKFHDKRWKNIVLKPFEKFLLKICDIISVEQSESLNLLEKYDKRFKGKLVHLPNGYDDNIVFGLNDKTIINNKENLMITVGRIGTKQKNTEMLLKVLEKIKFTNGWKCIIIGSIEEGFKNKIEKFYNDNPDLKSKVLFVGFKNHEEVCEYYKKSKIFLLTSIFEGSPLVFPETLAFGNHIITTKVSGSEDITKNGKLGDLIKINDIETFSKTLQKYINDEEILNKKIIEALTFSKNYKRSNVIKNLPLKRVNP